MKLDSTTSVVLTTGCCNCHYHSLNKLYVVGMTPYFACSACIYDPETGYITDLTGNQKIKLVEIVSEFRFVSRGAFEKT